MENKDVIGDIRKKINKNEPIINYLSTGFKELDKRILGYQKGELITIASKTNGGKTFFTISTVLNTIQNKQKVLYFLMGESPEKFISKLLSAKFNFSLKMIQNGDFSRLDKDEINKFLDSLNEYLILKDKLFFDVYFIEQESLCAQDIDLVVVDSFSYLENKMDNKENIIKVLKDVAYTIQQPLILLYSLEANSDTYFIKNPLDTFGSNMQDIFEYSDKIFAIYSDEIVRERSEYLKELESKQKGQDPFYKSMFVNFPIIDVELHILKNDYGLLKKQNFKFFKTTGVFNENIESIITYKE